MRMEEQTKVLLKGENIPSSEGFPGQEDSSVEERQVSAEPHAPHLFPLERFLVQPQGKLLYHPVAGLGTPMT